VRSASRLLWLLFAVNLLQLYRSSDPLLSVPAVKTDLELTDTQLGLLASAFMWVYLSCAGLRRAGGSPSGRLMAWRGDLERGHGALRNGPQLRATPRGPRAGRGRRASYGSVAPAILSDAFEPAHRAEPWRCFPWPFPWGARSATCSGMFERAFGWRAAFFIVGSRECGWPGRGALSDVTAGGPASRSDAARNGVARLTDYLELLKTKSYLVNCLAMTG